MFWEAWSPEIKENLRFFNVLYSPGPRNLRKPKVFQGFGKPVGLIGSGLFGPGLIGPKPFVSEANMSNMKETHSFSEARSRRVGLLEKSIQMIKPHLAGNHVD